MTFKLRASRYFYSPDEAQPLRDLGFVFEACGDDTPTQRGKWYLDIDETMPTIDISTLDALLEFVRRIGPDIVLTVPTEGTPIIEIYNGYRE